MAKTAAPVQCAKCMVVVPQESFTSRTPLNVLLVPGNRESRMVVANPALVGFVEQQTQHCQAALSVCTGAFTLHAAGLL